MKSTLRPYHQLVIILLILLIHGSMLMTFVLIQFQSNSMNLPPQEALVTMEEESPAEDRDWVAMNNALPNSQHIVQEAQEQETHSEQEQKEELAQDESVQQAEQHPTPQEQKKSEMEVTEHALDDAIALASRMLDAQQPEKTEPAKEPEHKREKAETQLTKSPSNSKQIPTLAQITQGFVEHLQQADMAVRSNRDGIASIDQIKHLNYCQKIIGCIVNAYKINNHTAPNKSMLANRARIKLALNRNGTIAHLALQASSGDSAVDKFLIDMFREASSSFPPVPAALKESPYQLPSFSVDSLESFRSIQGWHIDTTAI